jgi:hypothetical protein
LDCFIAIPKFGHGLNAKKSGKIIDSKTGAIFPKDFVFPMTRVLFKFCLILVKNNRLKN